MITDPNQLPPDDFEARLTALLLGELDGAEAESVWRAIEADDRLAAQYERLKKTAGLVREVTAAPAVPAAAQAEPLRLSEERRQKLLASFKTITPVEFVKSHAPRKIRWKFAWLIPLAACLVLHDAAGRIVAGRRWPRPNPKAIQDQQPKQPEAGRVWPSKCGRMTITKAQRTRLPYYGGSEILPGNVPIRRSKGERCITFPAKWANRRGSKSRPNKAKECVWQITRPRASRRGNPGEGCGSAIDFRAVT